MASAAPEARKIEVLQAGRAVAALAVVLLHAQVATEAFVGALPAWLKATAGQGYLGVDFFFVLSGFIIFYTNHGKTGRPGWRSRFARSRFVRIFVPYLPVGIAMALLYTFLPQLSAATLEWSWLSTLTLIPTGTSPALTVAWTLQHELVFYALALLFLRLRRPLLLAAGWAAAILAWQLFGTPLEPPPTSSVAAVLLHPINLEFLFGMLAAWAVIQGRLDRPLAMCALGALFLAAFLAVGAPKAYSVLFGLGLAFFIPVLVRMEQSGRLRVAGWLLVLGEASYALYLIHNPLISTTSRAVAAVAPHWLAGMATAVIASVAASLAYYFVYERPARRRVAALLAPRPALATAT
ncbi:MAG TPA: acyltransferase [Allosphingosinicella sp.]|nr:acyltransferase [Allosphingosinicella sp.]